MEIIVKYQDDTEDIFRNVENCEFDTECNFVTITYERNNQQHEVNINAKFIKRYETIENIQ